MGTLKRKDDKRWTIDEYLRLSDDAPEGERYELLDGKIVAMTTPSDDHRLITASFIGELYSKLIDKPCRVVGQDQMVGFADDSTIYIPDVVVRCAPEEWRNPDDKKILLNPTVIVEVRSPSSEKRDLEKAIRYLQIPSLHHLLLVSQDEPEILHVWREVEGGRTHTVTLNDMNDTIHLIRLGCMIELRRVYRDIFEGKA